MSSESIFEECSKLCTDRFWKKQFMNLSKNRSPKGIYINPSHIVCTFKGREFSYKYTSKPFERVKDDIINLFKTELSIRSSKDRRKMKGKIDTLYNTTPSNEVSSWKVFRTRTEREHVVYKFAEEIATKHNKDKIWLKKLYHFINSSISTKRIARDDIVIRNRRIVEIKSLKVSKSKFSIKSDSNTSKISKKQYRKRSQIKRNNRGNTKGNSNNTNDDSIVQKKLLSKKWSLYVDKIRSNRAFLTHKRTDKPIINPLSTVEEHSNEEVSEDYSDSENYITLAEY